MTRSPASRRTGRWNCWPSGERRGPARIDGRRPAPRGGGPQEGGCQEGGCEEGGCQEGGGPQEGGCQEGGGLEDGGGCDQGGCQHRGGHQEGGGHQGRGCHESRRRYRSGRVQPGAGPSGQEAVGGLTDRGRFLVLEGGEGTGKSTQAARLAAALGALLTREPGGTSTGERLRTLLLDPALPSLDRRAETLLLLAARAQHVAEVVAPALAAGRDVVCERFSGSTIAYQGYGRGLDPGEVARLSEWASAGVEPDRVVLLRTGAAVASDRLARRAGGRDRFESEADAFFTRVDQGYAVLAAADPVRWRVVDGTGTIEEVAGRVAEAAGP